MLRTIKSPNYDARRSLLMTMRKRKVYRLAFNQLVTPLSQTSYLPAEFIVSLKDEYPEN